MISLQSQNLEVLLSFCCLEAFITSFTKKKKKKKKKKQVTATTENKN
jgi:hypothetical protein